MRLGVAAGARPVEQQHLAGLLGDRAPEVLLDQIGGERRRAGAAGAGDARPVGEEQPVGDHVMAGKRLEEVLVVIPAHARAPALHEAGAAQNEAAGADADQRYVAGAHLAQIAHGGLIDLRAGVQDAADRRRRSRACRAAASALVGSIMTPQLAGTDSGRLDMMDHCTCSGRLRSPSSAARRRWSMNTAKAESVKCSARTMPTRSGGRALRSSAGPLLLFTLEWCIERALNPLCPPTPAIFHQAQNGRKERVARERTCFRTIRWRVSLHGLGCGAALNVRSAKTGEGAKGGRAPARRPATGAQRRTARRARFS